MLLTIDIGNSNLFAVLMDEDGNRCQESRIETKREYISEYYGGWLDSFCQNSQIDDFILSCVVPAITAEVMELLQHRLKVKGMLVSMELLPEFEVLLDNPAELGADFIASSYGAMKKYPLPLIIVDMGTANKISVINEERQFLGGIISSGLGIVTKAMEEMIPHLPKIELKVPEHLIGLNTVECMQSGIVNGTIQSISGICTEIEKEHSKKFSKILTGGYGNIVYEAMSDFIFDPYLLTDGLFVIYKQKKC